MFFTCVNPSFSSVKVKVSRYVGFREIFFISVWSLENRNEWVLLPLVWAFYIYREWVHHVELLSLYRNQQVMKPNADFRESLTATAGEDETCGVQLVNQ